MRKPLATRKQPLHKNMSTQYGAHIISIPCMALYTLSEAFEQAVMERKSQVMAQNVKNLMEIEPSTDDLDIRTF